MTIKRTIGYFNQSTLSLGMVMGLAVGASAVQADDIEIYLQPPPDPAPPNVLFILDESGSMQGTRMANMKDAMRTILNDPLMDNVNAGILGYTTNGGQAAAKRLTAISQFRKVEDHRNAMITAVDALTTVGWTPTVRALDAGVRWFQGVQQINGQTWASPIGDTAADNWCVPNHMVILSDGSPNSNRNVDMDPIRRYPEPAGPICTNPANIGGTGDQCATEISNWAFNTDLKTGAGWDEDQNIVTHAISFNAGGTTQAFMESIAAASGNGVDPAEGEHYVANNAATLVAAFASIITQAAQSIEYTYSSPVIPFNPDDAAVSGEFLYVPMFEPEAEKFWKGNLKKYRLTTNSDGDLEIKDSNTADVVDDAYEFVSSTDLWSTSADGGEPLVGGVAQHKTGTRVLYTYLAGVANQDLTNGVNRVRDINANITEAMLGAGSPAERKTVLDWASREDGHVGEMGAPIHSKPVVVSYSSGNDLVLIPTSEGVLEAFDAETGHEVWGFIPEVLLQELEALRVNADSVVPTYGLDGPITTYKSGSRTYVVVGMRRGGKDYYALDITNRDAPEFAWSIMSTDSDFTDLAQTWSKPLFVRMDIGVAYNADADGDGTNDSTDVLVFAGGYDEDQDDETSRVADDEGNAIYIVNPRTGALIKNISNSGADINISDMTNSIASDLLTVDINANGIIDRLYAADVGGRIIRVDLPDSKFYDTTLSGGIVADINEGVSGGYRRFFNTPEVGYYNQGGEQYLSIMIGSGFRPEPADTTVTDRFYMMKDTAVWRAPGTDTNGDGSIDSFNYVTVTTDELNDVSNSAISGPSGWYFNFTGSEKSFSKAKLYNYVVMFTTYAGEARDDTSVCTAAFTPGEARFYAVDMRDASAVFADMDPSGGDDPTIDDRSRVLNFKGIPPSPSLVFPASGSDEESVVKAIVGLEEVAEWPDRFHAVYWEEVVE